MTDTTNTTSNHDTDADEQFDAFGVDYRDIPTTTGRDVLTRCEEIVREELPHRHELTVPELAHCCEEAREHWTRGVVAVFAVFGVDLTDPDGPSISPGDYQIPEAQWGQIARACTRTELGDHSPLTMAGAMLDFMNYGPGSY